MRFSFNNCLILTMVDIIQVLEYLLDDVSDFLSNYLNSLEKDEEVTKQADQDGCMKVLKDFLDYLSTREMENFKQRRKHNQNSVTLTTMHQVAIILV